MLISKTIARSNFNIQYLMLYKYSTNTLRLLAIIKQPNPNMRWTDKTKIKLFSYLKLLFKYINCNPILKINNYNASVIFYQIFNIYIFLTLE